MGTRTFLKMLVLAAMAVLLLAGCQSGDGEDNDDLSAPTNQMLIAQAKEQNLERLQPVESDPETRVAGSITLEGLTLANSTEPGAPELNARLLDPEDDILSESLPGADGKYQLNTQEMIGRARVLFTVPIEEDFDNDGEGDVLLREVPVQLEPGITATVNLHLSLPEKPPLAPGVGSGGGDIPELVLQTEVEKRDIAGESSELFFVFPEDGTILYDTDNDGFGEIGDDFVGIDEDLNGWDDASEQLFAMDPTGTSFELEGVVTSVNVADQSFTVRRFDSNETVRILLPPFVAIEAYSNELGFVGMLPLSTNMIGRETFIMIGPESSPASGEFVAYWVIVFRD